MKIKSQSRPRQVLRVNKIRSRRRSASKPPKPSFPSSKINHGSTFEIGNERHTPYNAHSHFENRPMIDLQNGNEQGTGTGTGTGIGAGVFCRSAGRPAGRFAVHNPWPGTFSIRHILTHTQIIRLTLLTQILIFREKFNFSGRTATLCDETLDKKRETRGPRAGVHAARRRERLLGRQLGRPAPRSLGHRRAQGLGTDGYWRLASRRCKGVLSSYLSIFFFSTISFHRGIRFNCIV